MSQAKVKLTLTTWLLAIAGVLIMAMGFVISGAWGTASQLSYEDIGITLSQIALITSAYTLGNGVSNFFGGVLVDRLGPKVMVGYGAVLTAVFCFIIPFCPNFVTLMVVRFIGGCTGCGFYAGLVQIQMKAFPPERRGFAHGLMMTGPNVGLVLSNAIFPALVLASGWRSVFYIGGLMCLAVSVFFLAVLVVWMKKNPEISLTANEISGGKVVKQKMTVREIVSACSERNFILGSVANFIMLGASTGISTYLLLYFVEVRGIDAVVGGGIIATSSFVGFFANSLAGIFSDILKSRKKVVVPGFFVTAASLAGLLLFGSNAALVACIFVKDSFFLFATRPMNVMVAESSEEKYISTTSGVYNAFSSLGMSVLPVVYGFVLEYTHNYSILMWMTFIMIALCGCIACCMRETYNVSKE